MSASEPIPPFEDPAPSGPPGPDDARAGEASAPPGNARPDWLVGAEEGAAAEHARPDPATPVRLQRPELLEGLEGREAIRPVGAAGAGLRLPASPDAGAVGLPLSSRRAAPAEPAGPQAWTAKSSSVPKLAVVSAAPRLEEGHAGGLDDDFAPTGPMGGAEPSLTLVGPSEAGPVRPMVRPLQEPWWMVLGERIATERKLQLLIVGAIAAIVAAFVFWPREGRGVSVRDIRKHPEVYEGQTVRVHGRVEEVFPIGNGWVYDLRQGRDTITVFTRGAMPERHQDVHVVGQVSTGYMDGAPRTAILENGGS